MSDIEYGYPDDMDWHPPGRLIVRIDTGNSAFSDPGELAAILRELAEEVDETSSHDLFQYHRIAGTLKDSGGNEVGKWAWLTDPDAFSEEEGLLP